MNVYNVVDYIVNPKVVVKKMYVEEPVLKQPTPSTSDSSSNDHAYVKQMIGEPSINKLVSKNKRKQYVPQHVVETPIDQLKYVSAFYIFKRHFSALRCYYDTPSDTMDKINIMVPYLRQAEKQARKNKRNYGTVMRYKKKLLRKFLEAKCLYLLSK